MIHFQRRWIYAACILAVMLSVAAGWLARLAGGGGGGAARSGTAASGATFVGRESCARCHEAEFEAWSGSQHDRAMQPATERTVLGDFDDATYTYDGRTTRFFRKGDDFFIHTTGPEGKKRDFKVTHTFGVEPLQQYLVDMPRGRLQAFSIAWDSRPESEGGQRWFHLYPEDEGEPVTPDDPLHWSGRLQNWNFMCAQCHSTNLRKNYDLETDTYHTRFSEIDVSCEACHGPGSRHVRWARANPLERWWNGYGDGYGDDASEDDKAPASKPGQGGRYGLTTNLQAADNDAQINTCAVCHARRGIVDPDYVHGEPFMDSFHPQLLREGLYYPDGQIQDEVYVYGSFLQSKMYHNNIRCSDCHNPHTTKLRAPGNNLCTRCHVPDKQHPAGFDTPSHHHHEPGTAGARCANCHMPERTYMVIDPRRDHSLRIPRPDLSMELGTPNACNQCHSEKAPAWAARAVERWFGEERPDAPHYGPVLAAGRAGDADAERPLIELAGDSSRPAIVRATALLLLRRYDSRAATDALRAGLDAAEPMIRRSAVEGMTRLPPRPRVRALAPLLDDPYKAVRTEAARVLSAVSPERFSEERREAFNQALAEFVDGQRKLTDQPGGLMNLAIVSENRGDQREAIRYYKAAVERGERFIPARMNLAMLYNGLGRKEDARRLLREVIDLDPDFGQAHYSLGLLLAEDPGQLSEAARHLGIASERMPDHARASYNYALALQKLGRMQEAERPLLRAYELRPRSTRIVYALALYYQQTGRTDKARRLARYLVRLAPRANRPRQLLQRLQK